MTRDPARRPDQVYNLGCAFALAGASAAADPKLPKAERDALAEGRMARAVKLLGEYAAAGLLGPQAMLAQIKGDADLAPLRRRSDFQGLVRRLESRATPRGEGPPKGDTPSPGR